MTSREELLAGHVVNRWYPGGKRRIRPVGGSIWIDVDGKGDYLGNMETIRDYIIALHNDNPMRAVAEFIAAKNATHDSALWESLIREEMRETLEALDAKDDVLTLDGFADVIYVIAGYCLTRSWDLNGAFGEVHRSNMTKEAGSGDHKIRKTNPEYSPPELERFLHA